MIGGGGAEDFGKRLEPHPSEARALPSGSGIETREIARTLPQVYACDVPWLDHQLMVSDDSFASFQHFGLQPLAKNGRQVSRRLGAGNDGIAIGDVLTGLPDALAAFKPSAQASV